MFKLGRISPPDYAWINRTFDGEWELIPHTDNEVWVAMIDYDGPINTCKGGWSAMIEVRGDSEEEVKFLAEQICSKLNDPKTNLLRQLKLGD